MLEAVGHIYTTQNEYRLIKNKAMYSDITSSQITTMLL